MRANPGGYIPSHEVIGRDRLIARLWQTLARQSLVLTAERRMGKTSILRQMAAESPEDMIVVYHELEHINTPCPASPGYSSYGQYLLDVRDPL